MLDILEKELMRSERQEKAKEEAAPEIQYTQKEVAEMLSRILRVQVTTS